MVLSNRVNSKEWGVGQFGKTHLVKLAEYVSTHYTEVKTIGPWEEEDALNFPAVKILVAVPAQSLRA